MLFYEVDSKAIIICETSPCSFFHFVSCLVSFHPLSSDQVLKPGSYSVFLSLLVSIQCRSPSRHSLPNQFYSERSPFPEFMKVPTFEPIDSRCPSVSTRMHPLLQAIHNQLIPRRDLFLCRLQLYQHEDLPLFNQWKVDMKSGFVGLELLLLLSQ